MADVKWKLLTIGHLSRNKYWGESDHSQYHPVLATTVLIQDGDMNIIVDPSEKIDDMAEKLKKFAGLTPEDIDIVYSTHFHQDHRVDIEFYPNAVCFMSKDNMEDLEWTREEVAAGRLSQWYLTGRWDLFKECENMLTSNIRLYPMHGHTAGTTGLLFQAQGKRILIAGDTIMGQEYFEHKDGYWFNTSLEDTKASILNAAGDADIIIPGHGDAFAVCKHRPMECIDEKQEEIRRLNLDTEEEESSWLVLSGSRKILVNPGIQGDLMVNLLYNRSGILANEITDVYCTDGKPCHRRDFEVFKNAEYFMPEEALRSAWEQASDDEEKYWLNCFKGTKEVLFHMPEKYIW